MRNQFVFLIMNFLRSLSNVSASLDILFVDYDRELYYCDRIYTNLLHIISGMSLTLEVLQNTMSNLVFSSPSPANYHVIHFDLW